jgi:hypothetical protein
VDPRAGLDTEARGKILSPLPGIEHRSPGRPARNQTLYYLSYPDSYNYIDKCRYEIQEETKFRYGTPALCLCMRLHTYVVFPLIVTNHKFSLGPNLVRGP